MHFNKSASDITYLLACFVTYFRTHSLLWMCKLPLEQMHSLTCMDVQTSTWATNALTHLYGCANFHLSNKCTHSLTCMDVQTSTWAKWHEINMWNTWREYELKLSELLVGTTSVEEEEEEEDSFLTWQKMIPQTEPTHLQRQKKKRYTSTTELLPLPKCRKLSSPCQNCNTAICLICLQFLFLWQNWWMQ